MAIIFINESVPLPSKPTLHGKIMSCKDFEIMLRIYWNLNKPKKKFNWEDLIYEISNDQNPNSVMKNVIKDVDSSLPEFSINAENLGVYGFSNSSSVIRCTKTGVPYLICWGGGDWEVPICWMLYCDGSSFRGYVPTRGNCFNLLTNELLGNDEQQDDIFLKQEGVILEEDDRIEWDLDEVIREFEYNIIPIK